METRLKFSSRNRRPVINVPAVVLTVAVAIVIVGCGGGSNKSESSNTVPPAGDAATNPTATTDKSCGRATVDAVKKHLGRPDVVDVRVIGGCSQLSIATSLDPSASAQGQAICDKAAEVAYGGEISSITVIAANNRELAAGLKSASCIGEP